MQHNTNTCRTKYYMQKNTQNKNLAVWHVKFHEAARSTNTAKTHFAFSAHEWRFPFASWHFALHGISF